MNRKTLLTILPVVAILLLPSTYFGLSRSSDFASFMDRIAVVALAWSSVAFLLSVLDVRGFLVFAVPFAALAPMDFLHTWMYSAPTSHGMINSALDTTPGEAREMMGDHPVIIALGFLAPLYCIAILYLHRRISLPFKARASLLLLALAPLCLSILRYSRWGYTRTEIVESLKSTYQQNFPVGAVMKLADVVAERSRSGDHLQFAQGYDWHVTVDSGSNSAELIVLVIGESSRSDHWALGGYPKATNPELSKDSSVVFFRNVHSTANLTNLAVGHILTLASPDRPTGFDSTSSVLSAFKQAGWSTWWISNQGQFSTVDSRQAQIAQEADHRFFFPRDIDAKGSTLDSDLLPKLDSAIAADPGRKKFVVLHSMGSHFRYYFRYPPAFDRFSPSTKHLSQFSSSDPRSRSEMVNSYDNTILFTDHFLSTIASRVESHSGKTALVYLSDHGESLFESQSNGVGHGAPRPAKSEFEIPMIFTASKSWNAAHPTAKSLLDSRRDSLFQGEEVLPLLLDLAGIHSDRIRGIKSLLSIDWEPPVSKKILLPTGQVLPLAAIPDTVK